MATAERRDGQPPARPQPTASRPMPEVAGVEHRYVPTGRLDIHIAAAGSGPPLLLLHGWPQHWYAWRKLTPLLAGSHRLICPDLRGFGWTDAPARGYKTAHLSADVVALLV